MKNEYTGRSRKGAGVSTGGSIKTGGSIDPSDTSTPKSAPKSTSKVSSKPKRKTELRVPIDALHMIQSMDDSTFSALQSLASHILGNRNHMSHHFDNHDPELFNSHPSHLSKLATHDIYGASNRDELARFIHDEIQDHETNLKGGSLWDSVKHVASKAVDMGRNLASKASHGVNMAVEFGKRVSDAVDKGLDITDALNSKFIRRYSPEIANMVDEVSGKVKLANDVVKSGLAVGDKLVN